MKRFKNFILRLARPWPLGFDPARISLNASRARKALSIKDLLIVSRYNPFKGQRDLKILELHEKGLPQSIIVELSGLGDSSISRIILGKKSRG